MNKPIIYVVLCFLLISCAGNDGTELTIDIDADTPQGEFFANLLELCDDTFVGESDYPANPPHEELENVEFRATIATCTDDEVHIPLHAGDDESLTLIFTHTEEGLQLEHDHRNPDGTPQELTGYGGWATDEGTSTRQYFEADQNTVDMISESETNAWMIELNMEEEIITYSLERHHESVFRAELEKVPVGVFDE